MKSRINRSLALGITALAMSCAGVVCSAQTAAPTAGAMQSAEAVRILTESAWVKKVQATILRPMGGGGEVRADEGLGGARGGGNLDAGGMSSGAGATGAGEGMGGGGDRKSVV